MTPEQYHRVILLTSTAAYAIHPEALTALCLQSATVLVVRDDEGPEFAAQLLREAFAQFAPPISIEMSTQHPAPPAFVPLDEKPVRRSVPFYSALYDTRGRRKRRRKRH